MEKRGLVFVLGTAIISGFSIFVNKFGVSETNPYLFTGLKNCIVAVFLFSIIILLKEYKSVQELTKKQWSQLILIGFVGGSIPFLLFFKGLQLTTAVRGGFIQKSLFIFVAVLATFFLKEKLNKSILAGAVLLLIGNALVLNFISPGFSIGDVLIVIAVLFWAVEIVISKHVLKELSSNIVAFGRMFFGSLFIIIFLLITNQLSLVSQITTTQLSWILITSLFLLLYVFTFYTGLKYIQATVATSVLLLGQIITLALSYIFLHQQITFVQALGMLALVMGTIFIIGISNISALVWRTPHEQP